MKRVVSYVLLMLLGLILVHSIIPHDHGEESLSDQPTISSTSVTHNLLFLEIDLGEDHLEEYDQSQFDFVFTIEDELTYTFRSKCESVLVQDDCLPHFFRAFTLPNRGPPVA